jgi:hypothetical protein
MEIKVDAFTSDLRGEKYLAARSGIFMPDKVTPPSFYRYDGTPTPIGAQWM